MENVKADTQTFVAQLGQGLQDAINNMAMAHQGMSLAHQATMDRLGEVMGAMHSPKRIVRGPDGRAVGVESVPMVPTTETRQ